MRLPAAASRARPNGWRTAALLTVAAVAVLPTAFAGCSEMSFSCTRCVGDGDNHTDPYRAHTKHTCAFAYISLDESKQLSRPPRTLPHLCVKKKRSEVYIEALRTTPDRELGQSDTSLKSIAEVAEKVGGSINFVTFETASQCDAGVEQFDNLLPNDGDTPTERITTVVNRAMARHREMLSHLSPVQAHHDESTWVQYVFDNEIDSACDLFISMSKKEREDMGLHQMVDPGIDPLMPAQNLGVAMVRAHCTYCDSSALLPSPSAGAPSNPAAAIAVAPLASRHQLPSHTVNATPPPARAPALSPRHVICAVGPPDAPGQDPYRELCRAHGGSGAHQAVQLPQPGKVVGRDLLPVPGLHCGPGIVHCVSRRLLLVAAWVVAVLSTPLPHTSHSASALASVSAARRYDDLVGSDGKPLGEGLGLPCRYCRRLPSIVHESRTSLIASVDVLRNGVCASMRTFRSEGRHADGDKCFLGIGHAFVRALQATRQAMDDVSGATDHRADAAVTALSLAMEAHGLCRVKMQSIGHFASRMQADLQDHLVDEAKGLREDIQDVERARLLSEWRSRGVKGHAAPTLDP